MKRYWQLIVGLLAILVLALSGCGGGGGGGGGGPISGVTDTDADGIPDSQDARPADPNRFVSLTKLDLPGLQGTTFSSAAAINDSNLIAGTANDSTNDVHAVVWTLTGAAASQAARLELLPVAASAQVFGAAHGVNNVADTVGESEDVSGARQAIFWLGSGGSPSAASPTILPALTGAQFSAAYDINSGRRVVGESQSSGITKAVTWLVAVTGSTATPSAASGLGEPAGGTSSSSSAYFIGEGNQVVGEYTTAGGAVRGLLWNLNAAGTVTSMVELPPLAGDTESVAYGINDAGQIIGESSSTTLTRGVVWTITGTPATATAALLPKPVNGESNALAINDSGRVAGWTSLTSPPGTTTIGIWDLRNTSLFDTADNVANIFNQGYGINNGGTIVGMANNAAFVTVAQ